MATSRRVKLGLLALALSVSSLVALARTSRITRTMRQRAS